MAESITSNHLEGLPNEILLIIMCYAGPLESIEIFSSLNQRFNDLVIHSTVNFQLPNTVSQAWLTQNLSHLQNNSRVLSADIEIFSLLFPSIHLFSKLRTIVLKHEPNFAIELHVEPTTIANTIISCLQLCRTWNILYIHDSLWPKLKFLNGTNCQKEKNPSVKNVADLNDTHTHSYQAIIGLSIGLITENKLYSLFKVLPNLAKLRIKRFRPNYTNARALTSNLSKPLKLVRLNVTCDIIEDDCNIRSIETFIDHSKSSLQELMFSIQTVHSFDVERLEIMFTKCECLKKLHFTIQFRSETTNVSDLLFNFQTDWWLDSQRSPVLILRNRSGHQLITTMPCQYPVYMRFPTNVNKWLLNKNNMNSSVIKFKDTRLVSLDNNERQPVTTDLLKFIRRVFRSFNQKLSVNYWGFNANDTIFEELMREQSTIPTLPYVEKFDFYSQKSVGLNATALVIWLLLAPNVIRLDLTELNRDMSFALIEQINQLYETDERVRPILSRLVQVYLPPSKYSINDNVVQYLMKIFEKIFPKYEWIPQEQ